MNYFDKALWLVKDAEGFSAVPYYCPSNRLTQGYGRNLEAHPLSEEEKAELNEDGSVSEEVAEKWAIEELRSCEDKLKDNVIFKIQNDLRKAVLLDMCFNIGYSGLMKFKKMWVALGSKDYEKAALEMKMSSWYTQVGRRGKRNYDLMLEG